MSGLISTALACTPLSTVILLEDEGADKSFFMLLAQLAQIRKGGESFAALTNFLTTLLHGSHA